MMQCKRESGFTLVELMIVVAIIGIIAAIIYPSYVQYVVKSNRSAAESLIMDAAAKQQLYLLDKRTYASTMATLGYSCPGSIQTTVCNNYQQPIAITNVSSSPPTFTITATPVPGGNQAARDTKCAAVSVDQAGTKSISGTSTVSACW